MFSNLFYFLKKLDWFLILAAFLLICFGLAALYSIAFSQEETNFFYFKKQVIGAVIGFVLLFSAAAFNYKNLRTWSKVLYVAAFLSLLAVLFFGATIQGTTGWFILGGVSFQPVEFAKLILIIFLADYFSRQPRHELGVAQIVLSGAFALAFFILVLFQPDLGSAVLIFIIWFGMLILRGIKRKHLVALFLIIAILFSLGWSFGFKDYQKDRLLTFINPELDPLGSGYNVSQSIIAIGSGQLIGRGLGFGSQSQLKFLPSSQTDFIFAVLAEELGLLGVIFIFSFWLLLFWRLILATKRVRDDFALFFVLGAAVLFFSQMVINIGMNLGVMPVTGITLPFMSLGGSSLIISLIILGITESIIARS